MKRTLIHALSIAGVVASTHAAANITFYDQEAFRGRAYTADKPIPNFERIGINDRASSVIVDHGRWEICEDAGFRGRCVVLRPGNYDSLRSMGMNNRISSVRPVGERARMEAEVAPPPAVPVYEYRQRPNERIYEAQVTHVRAVVGTPERRCWVERQQVPASQPNVGGAVLGGILGGVIGHQIGGGRGNDVATAVGAVGGAAIGANAGREPGVATQDVQRCENVAASGPPQYWDVSYNFRGVEHRVQLSHAPGPTIAVNERGEPRG